MVNSREYRAMIQDISKSPLALYIGGMLALGIGLMILMSANTFMILTVFGYLAILKGVAILVFPRWTMGLMRQMDWSEGLLGAAGALCLVLGAYVCYLGFM